MANVSVFVCSLYVLLLTSYSMVEAMSDDQKAIIRQHFEELGMACMKDNPITSDDIASLRAKKVPTGPNAPCFLACVLKKSGIMDESGMLQKETILEKAKKVFDDEEEMKSIESYLHSCSHINNEAVSDGEKGCERAVLSMKCMIDNAAQKYPSEIKTDFDRTGNQIK